jgi:glutamate-ammonia-ligase adenylyltransferase
MTDPSKRKSFPDALAQALRGSHFLARCLSADASLHGALAAGWTSPFTCGEMRSHLRADAGEDPGRRLRALRRHVMARLIVRDLNGEAALDEVFATVTALAEEAVAFAHDAALAPLLARHGTPIGAGSGAAQALSVVGMGKLGGGELNVSSDIDLVFLYGEDGETDGAAKLSNHEFFASLGKAIIALLDPVTAEGFVFRVDMRLRPFGDSGPLACPLSSLENYFVSQGRPWERYAWLKARVIQGPSGDVEALAAPFVYRRYLDYGLLASLRELHQRIHDAAVQRHREDDIKVGRGGIREIEFIVQLLQLIRGGRDPRLRTPSTRDALALLARLGEISADDAATLGESYAFLRNLEHRLQYLDDQQTQQLPAGEDDRLRVAEAMGHADFAGLRTALDGHRRRVAERFEELFAREQSASPAQAIIARLTDPQAGAEDAALAEDLGKLGFGEPAEVLALLRGWLGSRRFLRLPDAARGRLEKITENALEAALESKGTTIALRRVIELLEKIDRRDAYLSLLVEYPGVLHRASHLMASSAWAAGLIQRHPILLDELLKPPGSFTNTDWKAARAELDARLDALGGDTERVLDELRHFKQVQMLRLTIADLEQALPVMALSDELTALADLLLDAVLARAAATVGAPPGLAVIGYGKLGGKELGYGSDLDIVFLYDEAALEHAEAFARLSQRVSNWLNAHTGAGVLYETDLRLRPDGASGMLVTSITAFRDYQLKRAWAWEHQALTRARWCAGDAAVGARFEAVRREVIMQARDTAALLADVVKMREKMRAEQRDRAGDLKHCDGGVIDLEFIVQALVLAHAGAHPELAANKGNHWLLLCAAALGLVPEALALASAEAYLAMRRKTHAAALNNEERVLVAEGELEAERRAVRELWRAVFGAAG